MMNCAFGQFDFLKSCRVGEACNPGPSVMQPHNLQSDSSNKKLRFTVCNPSAIHGKVNDFAEMGSHVYFISETSATNVAQKFFEKDVRKYSYRPFFSAPCSVRRDTVVARPSLRGDAYGSMILSKVPCRVFREPVDPVFWESGRMSFSILRIGNQDVFSCSIYGFAAGHTGYKKSTEALLIYAFELGLKTKLPIVIAGDFNFPIRNCETFKTYEQEGFFEINHFVKQRWGRTLPPTCAQTTSNDTFIFHPWFSQFVCDAWVERDHAFHLHDPLTVELNIPESIVYSNLWKNPRSWHEFDLSPIVVSECYDKVIKNQVFHEDNVTPVSMDEQFDASLQRWAQQVEEAISMAIAYQHESDANRQPYRSLPHTHKGRCNLQEKQFEPARSSPGGCKGHFNPTSESFTVRSRQKVKQVRRLQSLILNLKKTPFHCHDINRQHDILLEWNRIRSAPGYGRSWERWLLSFEVVEYVPVSLPHIDWLENARSITELDAQTYSYIESNNRAKNTTLKIELDVTQGFSRFTYKYLQKPSNPPLRDIAVTWEAHGVLLRASKGTLSIKVQQFQPWRVCATATFGDCQIEILKIRQNILDIRVVEGTLPVAGTLQQKTHACTPQEISCAFRNFWSQYWLRDKYDEQFQDDSWQPVIDSLNELPQHVPPCNIDMSDPAMWKQTALGMKKGKASGADGFAPEDLYILPLAAFRNLANLVNQYLSVGLSKNFLVARTVLLSKVSQPDKIQHGRPITIFGVLFRLITRHIARQLLSHWKKYIPKEIAGGIPGTGVQDISMAQQAQLETNLHDKLPHSGFTLDLIKAFNLVPRRAVMHIMVHYGAPRNLILFWINCLAKATRRVQLDHFLDEPFCATTGVPEGDCLSIAAMTAISWMFWEHFTTASVKIYCYADNWTWLTPIVRDNIRCFHLLLAFVDKLRLQVDFSKSWAFVSSTSVRRLWDAISDEFPPGLDLVILDVAKDLGACINYTRSKHIGPFKERFEAAMAGFHKLKFSHLSMQQKFEKIQVALLPRAFYAAEVCSPCENFFKTCRRSITSAVVSSAKHASSDIACHFLTTRMQDPFVYVLTTALRNLRRFHGISPDVAISIWDRVVSFQGKKSYGPGTSLSVMLRRIGWKPRPDGVIQVPGAKPFRLFQSSNKEIADFCNFWWTDIVHERVLHRKGLDENLPLSKRILMNVFTKLDDSSQKFVAQHITGAFQTEQVKKNWDASNNGLCPLCNKPDHHCHRVFECSELADVRLRHQEAIQIMMEKFKNWPWAPLPYRHGDELYGKLALESRGLPQPFVPSLSPDNKFVFYTDGSAQFANQPFIRHSSFAVVQDLNGENFALADDPENVPAIMQNFHISTLAFCPGKQSVPRSELAAVVNVAMAMHSHFPEEECEVYTDAQYVINSLHNYVLTEFASGTFHKANNQDLILALKKYWNPYKYHLHKVKAHTDHRVEADMQKIRHILGNNAADSAAKAALCRENSELLQTIERLRMWEINHSHDLALVYEYLSDLDMTRINLMPKKMCRTSGEYPITRADNSVEDPHQSADHSVHDAFAYLSSWDPGDMYVCCDDLHISDEVLQAVSGGTSFGWAVFSWLKTIRWLQSDESYCKNSADFGITWVELLFNFRVCTGCEIPVFVEQHTIVSRWVSPSSEQAQLLPLKLRNIATQIVILEGCVRQIQTLLGVKMTWGPKGKPPSLWHCQFFQRKNGFLRRPVIPFASDTMGELKRFLATCSPSFQDMHDFSVLGMQRPLLREVCDLEPKARRASYEKLLRLRRNA